eukprot:TRINITY_DN7954_c0_g1_i1.p1 TRINITY_DN7954_c0_g1~~TRINITY_DN7954_c0_g1_i1.p1  ORF type:complete len:108 (+),score=26.80 TRINITY_DN7954_c0_g1_i1:63-386(+)
MCIRDRYQRRVHGKKSRIFDLVGSSSKIDLEWMKGRIAAGETPETPHKAFFQHVAFAQGTPNLFSRDGNPINASSQKRNPCESSKKENTQIVSAFSLNEGGVYSKVL